MDIRRASLEDVGDIAAIHVRSWQEAYRGIVPEDFLRSLSIERREVAWRDALQSRTSDTWIAEDAGRVLGWINTGSSRDADAGPRTGELWAIYVDPNTWRRGVGRALWREAEAQLRAAGFHRVTLWVLDVNQRALHFYESIGFSVDSGHEKTIERGGATLREIRLRRDLCG
jgi:ribosomal protein S18 acetylase RimI-like enzyme